MSVEQATTHATPPGQRAAMTPGDFAELLNAFNDATGKLHASHELLRAEVFRLTNELTEANNQLERTRRLAALGEMAAGIAHEVRNPLGSIRLYARMLEQDLADRPAERKTAAKIADAARGLDAVVGDVLTFSREFKLRPCAVDVGDLVARSIEACQHDGVAGSGEVEFRVGDGLANTRLYADPGLVQQALTNVVRNAVEAMHEGPCVAKRLTIEASNRLVATNSGKRARMCVIAVRDSGPGVTPDVVARMFNPFFTTRGSGTGLGLAIVHRIIDAHGGRVTVRNNAQDSTLAAADRAGATITFVLPANAEQWETLHGATRPSVGLGAPPAAGHSGPHNAAAMAPAPEIEA